MDIADLVGGDLILFSGEAPIHRFVRKHTDSPWVQAAIVIEVPSHPHPFLFESTSRPICHDIESGTLLPGVRTTPLRVRIEATQGAAACRKLIPPLTVELKRELARFRKRVLGLPFDFSARSTRRTLRRSHTEFDERSFTCSGLVATAYQAIGIIHRPPLGPLPSNVWPADFATKKESDLGRGTGSDNCPPYGDIQQHNAGMRAMMNAQLTSANS